MSVPFPDRPSPGRCAVALLLALAGLPLHAEVVNRIVLRVNDRIATLVDYEGRRADRVQAVLGVPDIPADQRQELLASAPQDSLREIFDELLLLSRADQLGIEIPAEQLQAAYTQARERSGLGESEFLSAMRDAGFDPESFRERLRRTLTFQEVIAREVQERVRVPDEDVQRFYREHQADFAVAEQLRLRDLVILEGPTPDPTQRVALGETIRAAVAGGASLDDAAAPHVAAGLADGPVNLGFVARADLDPELAEAAMALEVGGLSAPIAGRGGHHLLQLLGRREATTRPLDDVRDDIRRRLREERYDAELRRYMEELANQAYIRQDPPPEAAGFRAADTEVEGVESPPAAPAPEEVEVPEVETPPPGVTLEAQPPAPDDPGPEAPPSGSVIPPPVTPPPLDPPNR